jgi:hypothetical protein
MCNGPHLSNTMTVSTRFKRSCRTVMLGVFLNPFVQPSHARGISDGGWFVCSGTPPIALPSTTTATPDPPGDGERDQAGGASQFDCVR